MFLVLEKRIADTFASKIKLLYGFDTPVQTEQPKQTSFGEIAVPAAFHLARQLKKAPKTIAAELIQSAERIEGVESIEIAGNGYLNVRFDRGYYGASLAASDPQTDVWGLKLKSASGKIIVEHTNINPNKAAHIGHLRNAILGDTFVRMLRSAGRTVEVQNYIDNTGVQVADVVAGFRHLEKTSPDEIRALIAATRFDYVCWDVYARVSMHYQDHKEDLKWRAETLHSIESGEGAEADAA